MRFKWLAALFSILYLCAPAHAQTGAAKTRANLNTEVTTNLASSQPMTALQLRQTILDMIASTWSGGLFYPIGAIGNGIADDRAALNSALTTCVNAGGGTVQLWPGRFLVNSGNLVIPATCILECPARLNISPGAFPIGGTGTGIGGQPERYVIVLNSSFVVSMAKGSGIRGCGIMQKASAALPTPATARETVTMAQSFAGTGLYLAPDTLVENVFIGGFDVGVMTDPTLTASRTRFINVDIDANKCVSLNDVHDVSNWLSVQCHPYLARSQGTSVLSASITGLTNNGAGLYRVTTITSPAFVDGDTVWIDTAIAGGQSAMGKWTITRIDANNFDLQGSDANGVAPTGTIVSGQTMMTGLSSLVGIGVGSTIAAGTGIPAATTVVAILTTANSLVMSQAATASNTGARTITDSPWASGGTISIDGGWRTGIGIEVTDSERWTCTGCFVYNHQTGYHVGTGGLWIACVSCSYDANAVTIGEPSTIEVLIDSTAKASQWIGYAAVAGRNPFVINSTTGQVPHMISGSDLDATGSAGSVMVELDSGSVNLTGNSTQSLTRWITIKDAAGQLVMSGNNLQNRFSAQSTAAVGKVISAGNWNTHLSATPTLNCSGGTLLSGSTDYNGQITMPATGTSCIMTFGSAFYEAPLCTVTSHSSNQFASYSTAAASLVIVPNVTFSVTVNYSCSSREGR